MYVRLYLYTLTVVLFSLNFCTIRIHCFTEHFNLQMVTSEFQPDEATHYIFQLRVFHSERTVRDHVARSAFSLAAGNK